MGFRKVLVCLLLFGIAVLLIQMLALSSLKESRTRLPWEAEEEGRQSDKKEVNTLLLKSVHEYITAHVLCKIILSKYYVYSLITLATVIVVEATHLATCLCSGNFKAIWELHVLLDHFSLGSVTCPYKSMFAVEFWVIKLSLGCWIPPDVDCSKFN